MAGAAIMFQGTGSDVGKSLIVAGVARALVNRGLGVAPFKPQNMSNNAAVTVDGGEIGRAQALQARAARLEPTIDMNPVLLKPETDRGAQIVVHGKVTATLSARDYAKHRASLLPDIMTSFERLKAAHDVVLVEGAGSPAEINLRENDIANMGFAVPAGVPVVLVGDIHRGGVMASVAGTFDILDEHDRKQIKAFIINKFHGDPDLFDEGRKWLEERTGTPCLGVLAHFDRAFRLPAEDAVSLDREVGNNTNGGRIKVCVLRLSRIANFDDLDPLRLEPGVNLEIVQPGQPIPADCKLAILPGSKATIADLKFVRAQGWDIDIAAHIRRGGHVLGLCGGYQMLGREIADPDGIEGPPETVQGLGHLDVKTVLTRTKALERRHATHVETGLPLEGYEIHVGETTGPDCNRAFARIDGRADGAVSGNVTGTYLHGCLAGDDFRRWYLEHLGTAAGNFHFENTVDETLDLLANQIERDIDLDRLLKLARI